MSSPILCWYLFKRYCFYLFSIIIEPVKQSTEMEICRLMNLFLLQFIYVVDMESGNQSVSLPATVTALRYLHFKFFSIDSVFLGALI